MIQILIILVVIGLIYSLFEKLFIWAKDKVFFAAKIVGLIILAMVAIAVGSALLPIILDHLLTVIACSLIFIVIYSTVTKKQRQEYVAWAEQVGFGKQNDAPGSKRIWKWACEKGHTEDSGSGYVWYVEFYEKVLNVFLACRVITEEDFQDLCILAAPMFNPVNTLAFLDCLRLKKILTPMTEPGEEAMYIANYVISDCEHLFEIQGGATEKEFSRICELEMRDVPIESLTLARFVLKHMVSHGTASKVPLAECPDGEELYISKNELENSKMKRVEISLDD